MTKKIQVSGATLPPIRDTSPPLARVDPNKVREALGAENTDERLKEALGPVTLFALREELVNRLQSSGGRPAIAGATRRAKVPLNDEDWLRLEELAAAVASPGFAPSAGQVAGVLLTLSIHSVASRATAGDASSPLLRELADLVAGESSQVRSKRST
jgi:hypothetical protein